VELATANGERRRKKMEERQGEEMEGVGSRRGGVAFQPCEQDTASMHGDHAAFWPCA
jgi:hypothetical protein